MMVRERQSYACALGRASALAELLSVAIGLPGAAAVERWVYVWETPGRLHGEDLTDMVIDGRNGLQRLAARFGLGGGAPAWQVRHSDAHRYVSDAALVDLYERLGFNDLLGNSKVIADRVASESELAEAAVLANT
ncbi:MAG: hypothetical protein E6Q40_07635 [Cupriavidus sp.]|nr:MAG: hypothetical protein E6Q40_07635 [Cupriavidus sp.]